MNNVNVGVDPMSHTFLLLVGDKGFPTHPHCSPTSPLSHVLSLKTWEVEELVSNVNVGVDPMSPTFLLLFYYIILLFFIVFLF